MMASRLQLLSLLVLLSMPLSARADIGEDVVFPGPSGPNDQFGHAVAMGEDFAVVGSVVTRDGLPGEARVYVKGSAGWELAQVLTPSDGLPGDQFGVSVAAVSLQVSPHSRIDWIAVGASGRADHGVRSGAVYLFRRLGRWNRWVEREKITAQDQAHENQAFGRVLAAVPTIEHSRDVALLAIGAPGDQQLGTNAGAAYACILDRYRVTRQQRLTAPDGQPGDRFGSSVALQDRGQRRNARLAVGAFGAEVLGMSSAGAAYIYQAGSVGFRYFSKLVAPDPSPGDLFGHSVGFVTPSNAWDVYVGEPFDDDYDSSDSATDNGAVHRFHGYAPVWDSKILGDSSGDWFGYSLGSTFRGIVVGAPRDDVRALNAGALYRLSRDLDVKAVCRADASRSNAYLGLAVAGRGTNYGLTAGDIVAGAPDRDGDGLSGRAMFFHPYNSTRHYAADAFAGLPHRNIISDGNIGDTASLYLTAVDGVPLFDLIAQGAFDPTHHAILEWMVPTDLAGHTIEITAIWPDRETGQDRAGPTLTRLVH